jgi:hypothetical protein
VLEKLLATPGHVDVCYLGKTVDDAAMTESGDNDRIVLRIAPLSSKPAQTVSEQWVSSVLQNRKHMNSISRFPDFPSFRIPDRGSLRGRVGCLGRPLGLDRIKHDNVLDAVLQHMNTSALSQIGCATAGNRDELLTRLEMSMIRRSAAPTGARTVQTANQLSAPVPSVVETKTASLGVGPTQSHVLVTEDCSSTACTTEPASADMKVTTSPTTAYQHDPSLDMPVLPTDNSSGSGSSSRSACSSPDAMLDSCVATASSVVSSEADRLRAKIRELVHDAHTYELPSGLDTELPMSPVDVDIRLFGNAYTRWKSWLKLHDIDSNTLPKEYSETYPTVYVPDHVLCAVSRLEYDAELAELWIGNYKGMVYYLKMGDLLPY